MKKIIIAAILIIATFFRFYKLSSVPPSPSLDEVSLGYNAYSILKTGADEYGINIPLLLRAYDDWRPALYVYLVIPFIKIFGLSVLAVRLPSAILSLITVAATYFLSKELLKKSALADQYSLLASFLLAISPWHIYISRLGHEVNPGLTFSVLSVLFFLRFINSNHHKFFYLLVSSMIFSLAFYTYQSQKIFGPVMALFLGIIFFKDLARRKREIFLAFFFGLILILPIVKISAAPAALSRFQGTSIFSNQQQIRERSALRISRDYENKDILGLIFDNRRLAIGSDLLHNYISNFNPSWLFFNSGQEKHKIPSLGLFYLWELPFMLIGILELFSDRFPNRLKLLILAWIIAAPLPSGITTDAPHAMRSFNMLPMPQIITAIGIVALISKLPAKGWSASGGKAFGQRLVRIRCFLFILSFCFLLFNFCFLYHNYFVNFPVEQSGSFQYALAQSIPYVLSVKDNYSKIIFSNRNNLFQSYMFFLYYSQYDPILYLKQGGTISGGYKESHFFDKYEFRPIDWAKEKKDRDILYLGNIDDFPKETIPQKIFKLLDGGEAIKIL